MSAWQCPECAAVAFRRVRPGSCAECGAYPLEPALPTSERADAVSAEAPERDPTGEAELDALLGGGLVRGSRALLYGRGGTGKSRCAFRWGTHIGTTLALSLEMPVALAALSARDAGADLSRLHLLTSHESLVAEARIVGARVVIVDSLSEHPDASACLRQLGELATLGVTSIYIAHRTIAGHAKGGSRVQHAPDYELFLSRAGSDDGPVRVAVRKSRFSGTGEASVGALSAPGTPPRPRRRRCRT